MYLVVILMSRFIVRAQPTGGNNQRERMHAHIHILIETRNHDTYIRMVETVRIFGLEAKDKGKVHSVTDHQGPWRA